MLESRSKKDDFEEVSPFEGVKKNVVLHEAKMFNDPQLNSAECYATLTKIMYLLIQGEYFHSEEATKLFFGVTKLFQSQDVMLRRMVYLVIKELGRHEDNVFIVINCLSKDMTSSSALFQSNALRVLAKIIDASMLGQMERFIKQAVVDKNPLVASSALLAGHTLFHVAPEVVKRWANQVQEALSSKHKMVQYHALALLYHIRKHDRLAITKVVSALAKRPPRSPLAHCLLIRYVVQVLLSSQLQSKSQEEDKSMLELLHSSLRHKSDMVVSEAAKALVSLPSVTAQQLAPAISALQDMLGSAVSARRFAAVRTLSMVVDRFPMAVTPCSVDLELLISEPNRNTATLAITTLLKTGVESSVDRLVRSISSFMSQVSDELRVVLVEAIGALCFKFPQKHELFMEFLSTVLREEGGFAYKKCIVSTFVEIMQRLPLAKDAALEYLCDFIEDCEFPQLSVQILFLLGEEGPNTANPSRYIRYIFNRVILERPEVRSAAVASLAKFAKVSLLRDTIKTLLSRCLTDNDDEVRDRAVFYSCALDGEDDEGEQGVPFLVPLKTLEHSLEVYLQGSTQTPFSFDHDIVAPTPTEEDQDSIERGDDLLATRPAAGALPAGATTNSLQSSADIYGSIPEFTDLGPRFHSSPLIEVTEAEAEYRVTCIKHVLAQHVVFQFHVTNHMEDQLLANVEVEIDVSQGNWFEEMSVPIDFLAPGESGVAFSCLSRAESEYSGVFPAMLRFVVKDPEGDLEDEGIEDEYQLEELEVLETDCVRPVSMDMSLQEFRGLWEGIGADSEVVKRFGLGMNDLQEAVNAVVELLNLRAIDGSGVLAQGTRSHTINLCGEFLDGSPIYARARFVLDKTGVTLKIATRSNSLEISEIIPRAIQ